jgi:hypothetical protein
MSNIISRTKRRSKIDKLYAITGLLTQAIAKQHERLTEMEGRLVLLERIDAVRREAESIDLATNDDQQLTPPPALQSTEGPEGDLEIPNPLPPAA